MGTFTRKAMDGPDQPANAYCRIASPVSADAFQWDLRGQNAAVRVEAIDAVLPGGGLALGAGHEITEQGSDGARASLAALFVAGILARLPGPVIWCLHTRDLFAPALARVGLHPDRVIYCETWKDAEGLPAMEEGLRHGGLAGVVGELVRLPLLPSRRLQLAAEASGVTAFSPSSL
jgi:protein ImuA